MISKSSPESYHFLSSTGSRCTPVISFGSRSSLHISLARESLLPFVLLPSSLGKKYHRHFGTCFEYHIRKISKGSLPTILFMHQSHIFFSVTNKPFEGSINTFVSNENSPLKPSWVQICLCQSNKRLRIFNFGVLVI